MTTTKHILAEKIREYLDKKISANDLAEWAEDVMVEADIEDNGIDLISETLTSIGLINVKGFEMSDTQLEGIIEKLRHLK